MHTDGSQAGRGVPPREIRTAMGGLRGLRFSAPPCEFPRDVVQLLSMTKCSPVADRGSVRRRRIALALLVAVLQATVPSPAAAQQRDGVARPLIVAVVDSPPFAIKEADGNWSGLAVDLWRDIAAALGVRYELREVDFAQANTLLGDGSIDAALGAVTITADDEVAHD